MWTIYSKRFGSLQFGGEVVVFDNLDDARAVLAALPDSLEAEASVVEGVMLDVLAEDKTDG